MTFAEWVAQSGLGSAEIGALIGRDLSTVTELIAGRRWPSGDTALRILEVTGGAVSKWDVDTFKENRRLPAISARQRQAEAA